MRLRSKRSNARFNQHKTILQKIKESPEDEPKIEIKLDKSKEKQKPPQSNEK